jgi:uncharacterized membrane protein YjjP (DUF1212 family)
LSHPPSEAVDAENGDMGTSIVAAVENGELDAEQALAALKNGDGDPEGGAES